MQSGGQLRPGKRGQGSQRYPLCSGQLSSLRLSQRHQLQQQMDRLKRVAGLARTGNSVPAEDWSSQTAFWVRDPYAVLVNVGGVLALAAFRSELLQVPTARGGLFSVPDMTPEQLDMEAAQRTGSLMHLSYSGGSEADGLLPTFAWSGQVGAQLRPGGGKQSHPLRHGRSQCFPNRRGHVCSSDTARCL